MQTLTGAERIFKALQLQEPDRVPHFELGLDRKVKEKISPGSKYRVAEYFNWDATIVDDRANPGYRVETLDASGKYFRDQWGTIRKVTSELLHHPVEAAVKSEKDLDTWIPPDPDEPWRYQKLAEVVKNYKGSEGHHRYILRSFRRSKRCTRCG